MRTVLKALGALLAVVIVGGLGFFLWAKSAAATRLDGSYEAHTVQFPVPFPLTDSELEALRKERTPEPAAKVPAEAKAEAETDAETEAETEAEAGGDGEAPAAAAAPEAAAADPLADVDLGALALQRAIERGEHLVGSRYACVECHGQNFGGGVMVDDPAIGTLLGPNITSGGKTAKYEVADWDRMVRHGIKPDGHPGVMPSEDYFGMSDQELSDIIAFIRSLPPVTEQVAPISLGPLGTVLMALGEIPISAQVLEDHAAKHETAPPTTAPTVEFGAHLVGVCTGCHGKDLVGGPVPGGPPDWAEAANLTPHASGLAGWSYEDFVTAMREATRPDGSKLRPPMTMMTQYAQRMEDVELRALWAYIQSVPAKP